LQKDVAVGEQAHQDLPQYIVFANDESCYFCYRAPRNVADLD
jgi:hypothetical protein